MNDVVNKSELRQLQQRVSIRCELARIYHAKKLFNTSGIPRLINLLADRSLLAGMALSTTTVDSRIVHEAVNSRQLKKQRSWLQRLWPFRTWSAATR